MDSPITCCEGGFEVVLGFDEPVTGSELTNYVGVLEYRLGYIGAEKYYLASQDNRSILVQVCGVSSEDLDSVLKPGRFEARIDGELAFSSPEVTADLGPRGSAISSGGSYYSWYVSLRLDHEGGERFCEVGGDKRGKPIDLFLDRPENTILVVNELTYTILGEITEIDNDPTSDSYVRIVEDRSLIPILVVENSTFDLARLSALKDYDKAILASDEEHISEAVKERLEGHGLTTVRKPREGRDYGEWILDLMGLVSSPRLRCDPCTQCKYSAQISGSALTFEGAKKDRDEAKALLGSGALPADLRMESKTAIPAC